MKSIGFVSVAFLLLAQTAGATSWSALSIATTPEDAPKVVAATDKLMSSKVGKEFPGKLLLEQSTANGADPTTHTFVPIFKTMAERDGFVKKLMADPAWAEFQGTMTKLAKPTSQVLYKTLKNWGDIVDTDQVWISHAFQVSDPPAFVAAIETFLKSETGKSFPGQVHLSQVVAAGISPVTHVVSVAYASETEMDSWTTKRDASKDWAAFREAAQKSADYLGANLSRTAKSWGPATLKALSTP